MEAINITEAALAIMRAEARAATPDECCGLLLGKGGAITTAQPARNVHPAPADRFEIDPQALIDAHRAERAGGMQVVGYYHSHPRGSAEPSPTDQAMAAGDGRVWAIIGREEITFWRDEPQGFAPLARE